MESKFTVRCVNGHQVFEMCRKQKCLNPSGICKDEDCEYSKIHRKCMNYCKVDDIIQFLMNLAGESSSAIDELIIGTINRMLKVLDNLKNQYLNKSKSSEHQLRGNNKELFQMMKKGPAKDIKPQLVFDVLEGENEEKVNYYKPQKLKQIAERVEKQQKGGLEEIRKWLHFKDENLINFVFDPDLTDQRYNQISNGGKNVKNISPNETVFCLLSPSVAESGNRKVTIKIVNDKTCSIILGIGKKAPITDSLFRWTFQDYGYYLIWGGTGQICNTPNENQHQKKIPFIFGGGDVIELEYLVSLQSLKVTNVGNKKSIFIENISNQDNDLHYLVITRRIDNQFEILE